MRKLRKITPAEVEEEKVLDPEVIGDVLENTPVLNNEELEDMDVVVPNFDEEDENTEGDIDLDAIEDVLENTPVLNNEELEDMDVVVPNFNEEDEDTEPEIHEEDLDLDAIGEVLKDEELVVKSKPVAKKEIKKVKASPEEIVKASLKPITKPAVKVAPKTPAKKPVAVKVSEVTEKPSEQELIKEKVKIMVKEKATEKAANHTPVVTKKAEPSSISFEDIKKHLLKPLPTIVPSFLRK
jgi:hypothetical protein